MLEWTPEEGARRVGHPPKRWSDDIEAMLAKLLYPEGPQEWHIVAANREKWRRMEEDCLRAFER